MVIDTSSLCSKLRSKSIYRSSYQSTRPEYLSDSKTIFIDLRTRQERIKAPGWDSDYRLDLMQENRGSKSYYEWACEVSSANDIVEILALQYFDIYTQNRREIADLFEFIARDSRPSVLIFCSAGKDRTGVIVALLIHLLGVSIDEIQSDYSQAVEQARIELASEYSLAFNWKSELFETYMALIFPQKEAIKKFITLVENDAVYIEDNFWPICSNGTRVMDLLADKFCSDE